MLTSFQPLFITTLHRSFLALVTHSQLFLLFIIYLLLDLYSAFPSKSLRHCTENLKTWPIEHYTSKIKLKLGKVDKQTGMENQMDNEWSGKKEKGIFVCSFSPFFMAPWEPIPGECFIFQISDLVWRCLRSFTAQKRYVFVTVPDLSEKKGQLNAFFY